MKTRLLMLFIIGMIAACKKDDSTKPGGNGGNNTTEYGSGKNALTFTIGSEKPITLKGDNINELGIWGSMYQWPVKRINFLIDADKSDYPFKIKLDCMDVLIEPVGNGVGTYIIKKSSIFDEGDNYTGRRFNIDSGRLEITKVEPFDKKLAVVQGSFTIWAVSTNKETGEKKNEVITGDVDYNEADYEVE